MYYDYDYDYYYYYYYYYDYVGVCCTKINKV